MTQRHLFLIDPLSSLNLALDSSLRMMFALFLRKHEIWIANPKTLSCQTSQAPTALVQSLTFSGAAERPVASAEKRMGADWFSAIHMRKDPPFDLEYLGYTWLLDRVSEKVKVYNDPHALRSINEKIAILDFPEATRPALLSSKSEELLAFLKNEANGDAILKPLDLFGGRGVRRIELNREADPRALLDQETAQGHQLRMMQAFDQRIYQGEVRAFTAFGVPIAWCLKKPAPDQFLANTRMGASLHPYSPDSLELKRVLEVSQKLLKRGVVFIGFDLIGGWISEINITSPRLLSGDDEFKPYEKIAELIEKDGYDR